MGHEQHWKGRACKVYSKVEGRWKMTMHAGLLDYGDYGESADSGSSK